MRYKYGEFTKNQMKGYKELLHNKIHWLLVYKETEYPQLLNYFDNIQNQLAAFAQLIDSSQIVNLANTIECARLELIKEDSNHKKYRKLILDAHSIIDSLPEEGEDNE